MNRIKVVIADDHGLVREGLRQLLEAQADIAVVGEAKDGVEALEVCRQLRPEVLLLDVAMPRMSGLDAIRLIRDAVPETRVIILSMYEKEVYAQQALRAGAQGYVLKGGPSSDLLAAIRAACRGQYFFSHQIHAAVIDSYLSGHKDNPVSGGYETLSDREKQVFMLLVEGNSTVQISKVLCISAKTVEKHRTSIAKKLGLSSLVDMVRYAIRTGIVDPESWKS